MKNLTFSLALILSAGTMSNALAADAFVTTLQTLPGKTCEILGAGPIYGTSEIRYGIAGSVVATATVNAVKGIATNAGDKGANTVLGLQLLIIPLERNKGREFGDVVAVGTMANCK